MAPDAYFFLIYFKENNKIFRYHCNGIISTFFQEQNKEVVVQCIVLHNWIIKHKAILDQFRKGVSIRGFLGKLEKSSRVFKHYFLHKGNEATAEFVRGLLEMPDVVGQEHARVIQMLLTLIHRKCFNVLLLLVFCNWIKIKNLDLTRVSR